MAENRASKSSSTVRPADTTILGPTMPLSDSPQPDRVDTTVVVSKRDDLAPGVHAALGASGARQGHRIAQHLLERAARRPPTVSTSRFSAKPWKPEPS